MLQIDALLKDKGVKLINERLEAWFNIHQKPDYDGGDFYAGSITSLLLDNKEFLDPANAYFPDLYMFHDREKRCMQIDKVQLYNPVNNEPVGCPISLFNQPYKYEHQNIIPDENLSITLLSCQLPYYYEKKRFRLKRVLSLPSNLACIIDDVSLVNDDGTTEENTPNFALTYYSHIHSRLSPLKRQLIPTGFIMYYEASYPMVLYCFKSNVMIGKNPEQRNNSFSWQLSKCNKIRSVHSFMRNYSSSIDIDTDIENFTNSLINL